MARRCFEARCETRDQTLFLKLAKLCPTYLHVIQDDEPVPEKTVQLFPGTALQLSLSLGEDDAGTFDREQVRGIGTTLLQANPDFGDHPQDGMMLCRLLDKCDKVASPGAPRPPEAAAPRKAKKFF